MKFYNLKTEEINVFAYNYGIITLFINVLVLLWHALKEKFHILNFMVQIFQHSKSFL